VRIAPVSALDLLSAVTPRRGYLVRCGLAYGELARQRVDVYAPERPRRGVPTIVFLHGGSWSSGRRREYRFVGQAFATAGYRVAIPDYRVYPEVVFPAFVEDAANAVAWLRGADPEAGGGSGIVLMGHSAGAHMAALLALDRHYLEAAGVPADAIKAVVGLSGPYDFLPLTRPLFRAIFPEESRAASQPINFASGGARAPFLLLAGARDRTVEPGNSARLAARIRAAGGRAEVKRYPRAGHLGTLLALARVLAAATPPVRADILEFLARANH
jgi:acetyl esterase/lipase